MRDDILHMRYKIGIYGSAVNEGREVEEKAIALGKELSKHNIVIITGAGHGMPYIVAKEAAAHDVEIWGFPPVIGEDELETYAHGDSIAFYKHTFFIPLDVPFAKTIGASRLYRNLTSTFAVDAGIVISGRWGSMNEFTNLYGMEKVIGVYTNTGGIADQLEGLMKKINKPSGAKIIFSDTPKELLEKVMKELDKRTHSHIK